MSRLFSDTGKHGIFLREDKQMRWTLQSIGFQSGGILWSVGQEPKHSFTVSLSWENKYMSGGGLTDLNCRAECRRGGKKAQKEVQ